MGIERVVDLTVTRIEGGAGAPSFNYPLILTDEAPGAGFGSAHVKRYGISQLSTVGTDFSTSGDTYKAALAVASQSPRPSYFYVGERTTAVATVKTLTFSGALATGHVVAGTVNGTAISVTFSGTTADTLTAIAAAIDAVEGVASATSNGTTTITITATVEWVLTVSTFTVTGSPSLTCATATTTAGRTIQDDIADAEAETLTNGWYAICPTSTSKGASLAAAAYVETLRKMLFLQSSAAEILDVADTDDLLSRLQDLAYERTMTIYTDDTQEFINAAAVSRVFAIAPGNVTFANKNFTGVTASDITETDIDTVQGKGGNTYTTLGGSGRLLKGFTADGNPAIATRDIDYFVSTLEIDLFNMLSQANKIPFTQAGIQLVDNVGDSVNKRMVAEGVFTNDPVPTFNVPAVADVPGGDKAAGTLSGVTHTATLANAIIKIEAAISLQLS